jgi:hypothetical protein
MVASYIRNILPLESAVLVKHIIQEFTIVRGQLQTTEKQQDHSLCTEKEAL